MTRFAGGLVNFWCRPTTMYSGPVWSADFPGALCARLEQQLGGAFVYLTGPPGGLVPAHTGSESFRRMGEALADQLFAGFMTLAAQSCILCSGIVISTVARGNVPLALVITVLNSLLAAVLTPLILRLTLAAHVSFAILPMMGKLILIILLPVVLGQMVRPLLARPLATVPWLPDLLTQLVILSLIYMSVGAAMEWLTHSPWLVLGLIVGTLALHLGILAVNYAAARWAATDVTSRRSLMFCCSQKTLATGSYIWSRHFAANPLGGIPLLLYHVIQLVCDSILAHWLVNREQQARTLVTRTT